MLLSQPALLRLAQGALAASLSALALSATAAPVQITFSGTAVTPTGGSLMGTGGPYQIELIMDNGSATPNGQSWSPANLLCITWRIGSGTFQQNLRLHPAQAKSGQVTTDANGALLSMFDTLAQNFGVVPYTFTGAPAGVTVPTDAPYWFIPHSNAPGVQGAPGYDGVFYMMDAASNALGFNEAGNGGAIPTGTAGAADWSAPQAVNPNGSCAGAPLLAPAAVATPNAVPALDTPILALLGVLAAALGSTRLRRRA